MSKRWILMVTFGLGCLGAGGIAGAEVRAPASQVRVGPQQAAPSYSRRAQAAPDLEDFQGGRQVIIATDYDVHILVGVLIIAAIVLLVLLL